ncbi:MAG: hypothetical protein C0467_12050 [Planctomycetaceae bacterium]|nr:hypothetical protein [Planctomycetaceae bacterium]
MSEPTPATPVRKSHLLEALLLAIAFAVAHTQSPLYFSNQNQYFVHGLADGGHVNLSHDWLANTTDPTPVFSALIAGGYRYLGEWSFQAAYFFLLMGYFLGMRWLVAALPGMPDSHGFRLLWAAGFIAAHAAVLRVLSVQLAGVDYPWFAQAGVAGQYLLGPGLQPSSLGVLLIAGLAAFANHRPTLACGLVGAACAFHSTYMLSAGSLVLGFLVVLFKEKEDAGPVALRGLLLASVFIAPVAAYTLFTFGPHDPAIFEAAQNILVDIRIPHHCSIARWLDQVAWVQLLWAGLGIALLFRSRLFLVVLIAASIGLGLTLIQYEYTNPTFALVFPWRISVVLVPLATAVILAKVAARVPDSSWVAWVGGLGVLALAAGGVWVMVERLGYRTGEDETPLYSFVRASSEPKQVYLLPVRFPAPSTRRGAMSASFTPPPRPSSDLIAVDLQRFRLHTGTPIYVDFKSVPYFEAEVLEWQRRMRQCEAWYAADWTSPERLQELRAERITHVVTPSNKPLTADYLEVVHSDPAYIVYRLK